MGFFAALVSELKKARCPELEGYRPASEMTSIYQWFSDLPAQSTFVDLTNLDGGSPSVVWLGIHGHGGCDKLSRGPPQRALRSPSEQSIWGCEEGCLLVLACSCSGYCYPHITGVRR